MSIFDYKAKDLEGNAIVGAVEAPNENVASDVLKERQLIVLSLTERRRLTFLQSSIGFLNRVSAKDKVIFARQLSVMISATVPITRALRILVKQTENVTFKIIISEIADEVEGGSKLSAALARYPQVFPAFFIHMVRAGETSGKLDETLTYLADQTEKDYDLLNKIRGAMIYPIFIMTGLVIVGAVMMIFVIPNLTSVLLESGAPLPLTTRALIATSDFLATKWWVVLLILIAGFFSFRAYVRTAPGKSQYDRVKLHIPIIGGIYRSIYLTRFSRSMSTLMASGMPLIDALEIVSDIVGNETYHNLIQRTIKKVEDGDPLSSVFAQSRDVPTMLTQMLNIGEQTGRLDFVLGKLSDFYAKQVETSVQNLVTLIEPLVMVFMGGAVGVLVSAILLPMYQLSTAV
ncbi:MAG: type II secretion system F family protein [Candidatus Kerfeldbacteria bacterium]|nr:type II secretion system F family protein [Candidatus Kerfeldbacteria bacterium]